MTDSVQGQTEGLAGLIQGTTYQEAPLYGDVNPEQGSQTDVTPGADSTPGGTQGEGLSPASGNTVDSPATGQQQGVTPPVPDPSTGNAPSPQYSAEEIRLMQEQIQSQQRYINMHAQQVRADQERRFQESLAEMDETERRAAIAEREARKYKTQAEYLTNQQRREQAAEQEKAKRTLATIVASDNGLPVSVSTALLSATSLEHMESMARDIAADLQASRAPVQGSPAQSEPQPPAANPYVAGGDTVSSDTTPKIEKGSGDILGLISQNQYEVVRNW
jgi:hypothetical protein